MDLAVRVKFKLALSWCSGCRKIKCNMHFLNAASREIHSVTGLTDLKDSSYAGIDWDHRISVEMASYVWKCSSERCKAFDFVPIS